MSRSTQYTFTDRFCLGAWHNKGQPLSPSPAFSRVIDWWMASRRSASILLSAPNGGCDSAGFASTPECTWKCTWKDREQQILGDIIKHLVEPGASMVPATCLRFSIYDEHTHRANLPQLARQTGFSLTLSKNVFTCPDRASCSMVNHCSRLQRNYDCTCK